MREKEGAGTRAGTQCTLTVAVAVRETEKVLLMELEDHAYVVLFVPVINHRHN